MKNKNGLTVTEISETMTYVSKKAFTFSLDDDKSRNFGVLFETVDMYDATGDDEFKHYPFIVGASLMVNKQHKSLYEGEGNPDQVSLMQDTNSYCGGVPIDHVLANQVKNSTEGQGNPFEVLSKHFSVNEACVITKKQDFGTYAAQFGRGTKHSYLQFKTEEAAQKYVELLTARCSILSMMIGFILDRPVNMVGDTGWKTFNLQVNGK